MQGWYAEQGDHEHCKIRDHVNQWRSDDELVDIKTPARSVWLPDLPPGDAVQYACKSVGGVIEQVEPVDKLNEVIRNACFTGHEYARKLQQNGELREINNRPVGNFFRIYNLKSIIINIMLFLNAGLPERRLWLVRLEHSTDEFPPR